MGRWIETFRGVVYPWQCDQQGHLNTMQYVGMFDAAFWHHVSPMGFTRDYLEANHAGFADVKDTIEYKAEVPAGARLVIESGLLRIGNTSITALHVLRDAESGDVAATSEKVSVYFDLESRKPVAIPDDMRTAMEPFIVDPPD